MPISIKSWQFENDLEGFVASDSGDAVATYDGSTQYEIGGSAHGYVVGRNADGIATFEWTGTFEDLGVPAGREISDVNELAYYYSSYFFTGEESSVEVSVLDGADNVLETITRIRTSSSGWLSASVTDTTLSPHLQSSDTVKVRITMDLNTANDKNAIVEFWADNIEVQCTHQALIQSTATTGGSISPSGDTLIAHGGNSAEYTFSPDNGYVLNDVEVDGVSQGAVSSYTFTDVTEDHTIHALFVPAVEYEITATSGANGAIDPSGAIMVYGTMDQTFTFHPDAEYYIDDVIVDGVSQGAIETYTFENVQSDHTIHVDFIERPKYVISATSGDNGNINPSGDVEVHEGFDKTFSFIADTNYIVSDVTVNGISQGALTEYTFTDVQQPHTIHATFVFAYTIEVTSSSGGSASPEGVLSFAPGDSLSITFSPNVGYLIHTVFVDGVSQGAISSYTFNDIQDNHFVHVVFVEDTEDTVFLNDYTGGTGTGNQTYPLRYGDSNPSYTALPQEATHVVAEAWSNGGPGGYGDGSDEGGGGGAGGKYGYGVFEIAPDLNNDGWVNYEIRIGNASELNSYGISIYIDDGRNPFSSANDEIIKFGISGGQPGQRYNLNDGAGGDGEVISRYPSLNVFNRNDIMVHGGSGADGVSDSGGGGGGSASKESTGKNAVDHNAVESEHDGMWSGEGAASRNTDGGDASLLKGGGGGGATSTSGGEGSRNLLHVSYIVPPLDVRVISAYSSVGGTVTPSGDTFFDPALNESQTFSFTPDSEDYVVEEVFIDGVSQGSIDSYTFTDIQQDHFVYVSFVLSQYVVITATSGSNGTVDPSGDVEVTVGGDKTFNFIPDTGYGVADVLIDDVSQGTLGSYTFTDVQNAHTIHVTFEVFTDCLLIVRTGYGGTTDFPVRSEITSAGEVEIKMYPSAGYGISDVTVNGASQGAISSLSLYPTSDQYVEVFFIETVANAHNLGFTGGAHGQIFKFDQDGNEITLGNFPLTLTEETEWVQSDLQGNLFFCTNKYNSTSEKYEPVLYKYDFETGNLIWSLDLYESDKYTSYAFQFVVDFEGYAYYISRNATDDSIGYINKIAPDGTRVQNSVFPVVVNSLSGSNTSENELSSYNFTRLFGIDTDGNIYFGKGRYTFCVYKYDKVGAFVWFFQSSDYTYGEWINTCSCRIISDNSFIFANEDEDTIVRLGSDTGVPDTSGNFPLALENTAAVRGVTPYDTFFYFFKSRYIWRISNEGVIDWGLVPDDGAGTPINVIYPDTPNAFMGGVDRDGALYVPHRDVYGYDVYNNAVHCRLPDGTAGWTKDIGVSENNNLTIYPFNLPDVRSFYVHAISSSGGQVSPEGIIIVSSGDDLTLSFSPTSGYIVDVFIDGVSHGSLDTYTFAAVDFDHYVFAEFYESSVIEITATSTTGGSISPSGTVEVGYGDDRTFTFSEDSGYALNDVEVDGVSQGVLDSYTFTNVQEPHTIHAIFSEASLVPISVSGNTGGLVSPIPNIDGVVYAYEQTSKTFKITPFTFYKVSDVLVDGVSKGALTEYTISPVSSTGNSIEAVFAWDTKEITASSGSNGSISPAGVSAISILDSQEYTFLPNTGYVVSDVVVDSVSVGRLASYTFKEIQNDHTIHVTFILGHTIQVSVGIGGYIEYPNRGNIRGGTEIYIDDSGNSDIILIHSDNGYTISDVIVDGVSQGILEEYTFTGVTGDSSITVQFQSVLEDFKYKYGEGVTHGSLARIPFKNPYINKMDQFFRGENLAAWYFDCAGIDSSGNVYFVTANRDWAIKTDSALNVIWERVVSDVVGPNFNAGKLNVTPDGVLYVETTDVWINHNIIEKIDTDGNRINDSVWPYEYGGNKNTVSHIANDGCIFTRSPELDYRYVYKIDPSLGVYDGAGLVWEHDFEKPVWAVHTNSLGEALVVGNNQELGYVRWSSPMRCFTPEGVLKWESARIFDTVNLNFYSPHLLEDGRAIAYENYFDTTVCVNDGGSTQWTKEGANLEVHYVDYTNNTFFDKKTCNEYDLATGSLVTAVDSTVYDGYTREEGVTSFVQGHCIVVLSSENGVAYPRLSQASPITEIADTGYYIAPGDSIEIEIVPNTGFTLSELLIEGVSQTLPVPVADMQVEVYRFDIPNVQSSRTVEIKFSGTRVLPSPRIIYSVDSISVGQQLVQKHDYLGKVIEHDSFPLDIIPGYTDAGIYCIRLDCLGFLYVVMQKNGEYFDITKYDPNGELVWTVVGDHTIGDLTSFDVDYYGSLVVYGQTDDNRITLLRAEDGSFVWHKWYSHNLHFLCFDKNNDLLALRGGRYLSRIINIDPSGDALVRQGNTDVTISSRSNLDWIYPKEIGIVATPKPGATASCIVNFDSLVVDLDNTDRLIAGVSNNFIISAQTGVAKIPTVWRHTIEHTAGLGYNDFFSPGYLRTVLENDSYLVGVDPDGFLLLYRTGVGLVLYSLEFQRIDFFTDFRFAYQNEDNAHDLPLIETSPPSLFSDLSERASFFLQVSITGEGEVFPLTEGLNIIVQGTKRTIWFVPSDDTWQIIDVEIDSVSQGEITEYTFSNIQADHTVHVTFQLISDYSYITASSGLNGAISPSGEVLVVHGESQTFNFYPDYGYAVDDVLVDSVSQGALSEYTFTNVQASHTIEVTFAARLYTISASSGVNGLIDPTGDISVNGGEDQSFLFIPDEGYSVKNVIIDYESYGVLSTYTFEAVAQDHTIYVEFEASLFAHVPPTRSERFSYVAWMAFVFPGGMVPAFPARAIHSVPLPTIVGKMYTEPFFVHNLINFSLGKNIQLFHLWSLGGGMFIKLLQGFGTSSVQKLMYQIGVFINNNQSLLYSFLRGDEVKITQKLSTKFTSDIVVNQELLNQIGVFVTSNQAILNQLIRGDETESTQKLLNAFTSDIIVNQELINQVGVFCVQNQSLLNQLIRGDEIALTQKLPIMFSSGAFKNQAVLYEYSVVFSIVQNLLQSISADPININIAHILSVLEKNDIKIPQNILSTLQDVPSYFYAESTHILLDGKKIDPEGRTKSTTITYSESNVHNDITIQSNDPDLFDWADPEINYGEPRIEIQIGTRSIWFLVETREGEKTNFTITGISVSAKEDDPYFDDIDFQLEVPTLASEIAESLTAYCPVDWQTVDWVVPAGFEFSGKSLDGIQRLASEVGAIVRCQDDGSLLVRNKRPVRPVHMNNAPTMLDYSRDNIMTLSHSEVQESGFNAVTIMGRTDEVFIPDLVVEGSPEKGQNCFVRVYWAGKVSNVIRAFVTDGTMSIVKNGAFTTETEEEVVEFDDGKTSVSHPIYELLGWEWIGATSGPLQYEQYDKELQLSGEDRFRVATVKYRTRFQRYEIASHDVERLIAVLFLDNEKDTYISVRTKAEPVIYGPPIDAPLLTTEEAAVNRGKAWIDDQYRKSMISIDVPFKEEAKDGILVHIDDAQIGFPGNYHVTSCVLSLEGPKVINQIEVEKCLTFFNT